MNRKQINKKQLTNTRIKVQDTVVVISGADRGRRGKVLFIDRRNARVIVEGVNKKDKFLRPSQENPKGGVVSREYPIHLSNVMLFSDKQKKGIRSEKIERK